MAAEEHFDVIILGAGQAGVPLARELAKSGRHTALVERRYVGGTCINVGCTPTKTMVASARVAHLARRANEYGVEVGEVQVDLSRVRQRKDEVVDSFRSGNRQSLEQTDGLDLIMGEARFSGERQVQVELNQGGRRSLTADTFVINTGARPRQLDLPGLQELDPLNSTTIMELADVPQHLIVLGGGYVGVEFGQMFRRFGSEVTIVQRGEQLLGREDPDVAAEVAEILEQDGVRVLLEAEAVRARAGADGSVQLALDSSDCENTIAGSHVLVAAGRVPNIDELDAERGGIELDRRGYIQVDEHLHTSADGVYAVGDVKGGPAFTHISYDDYRIVLADLTENKQRPTSERMVPYTIYIDPQLGRVGLSETQAEDKGYDYLVAKMPMAHVARAIEFDETRGFMKVVVDRETKQILGCAVLGLEGGEIMGALQIAMMGGLAYSALRDGVFAHPTLTESFNNLFARLQS